MARWVMVDEGDDWRFRYALGLSVASIALNLVVFFCTVLWFSTTGAAENTNALAISVTTIEVFLVVVALGGFWILRNHVAAQARAETRAFLKEQQLALMSRVEAEARQTAQTVALRVVAERKGADPVRTAEQTAAFNGGDE